MAFYHLRIITIKNKHIVLYDLNKEQIIDEYLTKYLDKIPFFVNGYNLTFEKIERFMVVKTDASINETESLIRQKYHSIGFAIGMTQESILDDQTYSTDVTNELIKIVLSSTKADLSSKFSKNISKVFVVHGHDTYLLSEVENFIMQLELKPIILFKEADQGKTIIEKIESYSQDVSFAIVIYSKCDMGCCYGDKENLKPRARQNVVFEHGYMISLLKRSNVCALVESKEIETPGDMDGVLYVPFDKNGLWKYKMAQNMKAAGLSVDLNKLL